MTTKCLIFVFKMNSSVLKSEMEDTKDIQFKEKAKNDSAKKHLV